MLSILIVDDDRNILKLLDFVLQKAGFSVITAIDGTQGLAKAIERPPDVAILDVMMPGLHGYDLCRRLRADPRTAHAKIVFLTARSQSMDEQEGLRAGADLFLSKPVMPDDLIQQIESLLSEASTDVPSKPEPEIVPVERVAATSPDRSQGRLLICFSRQPGVGVTTLAVNLSLAFALSRRAETPLVELHSSRGNLLPAFGVGTGVPYGDLVATGNLLDWDALSLHLVNHPTGVRILPAPPSASGVPPAMTEKALSLLRSHFSVIVADAANETDPRVQSALAAADLVLLVMTPEVSTIRSSLRAIHELRALRVPENRILLIVNNVRPQASIPIERIREGMKQPILGIVPHEPAMPAALRAGQPLLLAKPKSPASHAIGRIAMQLVRGLELS